MLSVGPKEMGGSSPTRLLLPRATAVAISGGCCCLLLLLSASFGSISASAKSDVSTDELRSFYDEVLNEPYAGQDPASMPPLFRSALAKYTSKNRTRDALRKATVGTAGAAGALLGLLPVFRYWGKRREERPPPSTSTSPDLVRDYKAAGCEPEVGIVEGTRRFFRDPEANWGNRLFMASAVAAAAMLLGVVGVGVSKSVTNKKIQEDRRRFRQVLAQQRKQVEFAGGGTDERLDLAGRDANSELSDLASAAVDTAEKVLPMVAAAAPPKEDSASGGSAASKNGDAEGAGGSATAGKGGGGGVLVGLGGSHGAGRGRKGPDLSQEVPRLVELSKQMGQPAVFHPH